MNLFKILKTIVVTILHEESFLCGFSCFILYQVFTFTIVNMYVLFTNVVAAEVSLSNFLDQLK